MRSKHIVSTGCQCMWLVADDYTSDSHVPLLLGFNGVLSLAEERGAHVYDFLAVLDARFEHLADAPLIPDDCTYDVVDDNV